MQDFLPLERPSDVFSYTSFRGSFFKPRLHSRFETATTLLGSEFITGTAVKYRNDRFSDTEVYLNLRDVLTIVAMTPEQAKKFNEARPQPRSGQRPFNPQPGSSPQRGPSILEGGPPLPGQRPYNPPGFNPQPPGQGPYTPQPGFNPLPPEGQPQGYNPPQGGPGQNNPPLPPGYNPPQGGQPDRNQPPERSDPEPR